MTLTFFSKGRSPKDGKGQYKSTNTPLRKWGTIVRTHVPNMYHPAREREINNGDVTGKSDDNVSYTNACLSVLLAPRLAVTQSFWKVCLDGRTFCYLFYKKLRSYIGMAL